jgi:hypothetical protein
MLGHRKRSGGEDLFNTVDLTARPLKKYPHIFARRGFRIKMSPQLLNDVAENLRRIMGFGDQAAGHVKQQPLHDSRSHEKIIQNGVDAGQLQSSTLKAETLQLYRAFVELGNRSSISGEAK